MTYTIVYKGSNLHKNQNLTLIEDKTIISLKFKGNIAILSVDKGFTTPEPIWWYCSPSYKTLDFDTAKYNEDYSKILLLQYSQQQNFPNFARKLQFSPTTVLCMETLDDTYFEQRGLWILLYIIL